MRCLLVAVASLLAGCDDPLTCTQIGCTDVLRVGVSTQSGPLSEFRGSFVADGDLIEFSCPGSSSAEIFCGSGFVTLRDSPRNVAIDVETIDGGLRAILNATPAYDEQAPNGRDCGPICRTAAVDIVLE